MLSKTPAPPTTPSHTGSVEGRRAAFVRAYVETAREAKSSLAEPVAMCSTTFDQENTGCCGRLCLVCQLEPVELCASPLVSLGDLL